MIPLNIGSGDLRIEISIYLMMLFQDDLPEWLLD